MIISIKPFIPKEITASGLESIEFDGLMNVSPTYTSIVTQRPTEDNETITDAIHNRPTKLTISILITENAQSLIDMRVLTNLPNATGVKIGLSHIEKQLKKLKSIRKDGLPITIETKFDIYSNYFIEQFNISEMEEEAIIISMNLVQGVSDENVTSNSLGSKIKNKLIGWFS